MADLDWIGSDRIELVGIAGEMVRRRDNINQFWGKI